MDPARVPAHHLPHREMGVNGKRDETRNIIFNEKQEKQVKNRRRKNAENAENGNENLNKVFSNVTKRLFESKNEASVQA